MERGKELIGVEEGKSVIMIYSMRKNSIFNEKQQEVNESSKEEMK